MLLCPHLFTDYDPALPSAFLSICIGFIFGAIHCIAWSLHSPSLQERLAWRISAVFIAGLPIPFMVEMAVMALVEESKDRKGWFLTMDVVFSGSLVLYVIARIVLLVLPCIALRALPPTALVEIQWAAFFPHIG